MLRNYFIICFRKLYAELSDFCVTTSVILFVFGQTALFRIAPILTSVFVVITLHQCISLWTQSQDSNDGEIDNSNDSNSSSSSTSEN